MYFKSVKIQEIYLFQGRSTSFSVVSIVGMYINTCYSLGLSFALELYHIVGFIYYYLLKKFPQMVIEW